MPDSEKKEPEKGGALFGRIFGKTQSIVGSLTAFVLMARDLPGFIESGQRHGFAAIWPEFAIGFTIKLLIVLLFNAVTVSLPLAGIVYYFKYLARPKE
jgi:hypothetical protein